MSFQVAETRIFVGYYGRIRETSDYYVVARGDSWSSAPSNTHGVLLSGAGTTDLTEFDLTGSQTTNISDAAFSTGRGFQLDCNLYSPATTWSTNLTWNAFGSFDNFSLHFQMKFDAAPAANVQLAKIGDTAIYLLTSRKLQLTESHDVVGTTVLSTNTLYQVEVIRTKSGTTYLRINETAEVNDNATATQFSSCQIGAVGKDTDPNCVVKLGDIAFTYHNDAPAWWNTTALVYGTVNAAGTYNDATGVGDTTNKYNNVDDYTPSNTTDYNIVGSTLAVARQTHNLADGTFSDTIKGITFYTRVTRELSAYNGFKMITVDAGTDYVSSLINIPSATPTYQTFSRGWDHRPGGGALTQATINAMEMGIYTDLINPTSYAGLDTVDPTIDGAETDFSGTPNGSPNKFTDVDSWAAIDYTDYVESSTLGHRQAFKYSVPSRDPVYSQVFFGAYWKGVGFKFKPYILSGATRLYGAEQSGPADGSWTGTSALLTTTADPNTGVAWTEAGLEAAQFGFEITAIGAGGAVVDIIQEGLIPFVR